ncbi:MAG: CPBP family intramembrane glutamic endopeptidase [Mycobacteriales bacterium]
MRERLLRHAPVALVEKVPRDHREPDHLWRRRRRVVAGTLAVGSALLERSLAAEPDSPRFYRLTSAVAATWVAGGLGSGPLHLGREYGRGDALRRPVATPVLFGVGAFGLFYGCALVAREIPVLERAISNVLDYADEGSTPKVLLTTLANGAAEEVFFRGALYAAVADRPVAVTTAAYTATTVGTKNPALVLAAAVMGTLFGLQRRASGGVQASLLTHVTWSALMLRFLPPLFRRGAH